MNIPHDEVVSEDNTIDIIRNRILTCTQKFVITNEIYVGADSIPTMIGNYRLHAAGLSSNDHSVVGLMCHGIPYIYDSNNIIANSNWPEIDFSGYYEKCMEIINKPIYNYIYKADFLLYVRE